jgi:hypothetical protein
MADQFGESVLLLKTSDTELKAGLRRAESAVVDSNARMNASINGVKGSMAAMGHVSKNAAGGLALAGAAAGAVGGKAGQAITPVISLGSALLGLSGPIAVIVGAVAVLGTAIVAAFNVQRISDWIFGVEEAEEKLKALQGRLKQQEVDIGKEVKRQQDRLKIAKGLIVASDTIGNKKIREATKAAEAAEAEKAVTDSVNARIEALDKEFLIITGQRKEHEFITNAMEREKFLALEKAKAEKAAADEVARQRQLKMDILAAEGPQNIEEARHELNELLRKELRAADILARRQQAFKDILPALNREQADFLKNAFDLNVKPEFKGAGGRSSGISSSAFTDISAIGTIESDNRDKKRNELLQEIAAANQRMARVIEKNPGVLNN